MLYLLNLIIYYFSWLCFSTGHCPIWPHCQQFRQRSSVCAHQLAAAQSTKW